MLFYRYFNTVLLVVFAFLSLSATPSATFHVERDRGLPSFAVREAANNIVSAESYEQNIFFRYAQHVSA